MGAGPNELPPARGPAAWRRPAGQFTDLLAVVLMVASAVTFVAYAPQDPRDPGTSQPAVAILCVVVLNASVGFAQEYSAERTAQNLQAMVPHRCRVVRDAALAELPVRELVPGGVVVLEAGDTVPADCRVVEAHDLTAGNAAVTGESEPVRRTAEPDETEEVLGARNRLFMGTDVISGHRRSRSHSAGVPHRGGDGSRGHGRAAAPEHRGRRHHRDRRHRPLQGGGPAPGRHPAARGHPGGDRRTGR